jgi:uncharacterized protein
VTAGSERTLIRTVQWRLLTDSGTERAELWREPDGWTLHGVVKGFADEPIRVEYSVHCSPDWRTRMVSVNELRQESERSFELTADGGQWRLDGEPVPEIQGCIDVDLMVSPSTNTLPIRRLGLDVGQSAEISAAWLKFPAIEIVRANQRYTRLADTRYRYESATFQADLDVDDLGLVTTYAGIWERDAPVEPR